jgi:hypothetical protein
MLGEVRVQTKLIEQVTSSELRAYGQAMRGAFVQNKMTGSTTTGSPADVAVDIAGNTETRVA